MPGSGGDGHAGDGRNRYERLRRPPNPACPRNRRSKEPIGDLPGTARPPGRLFFQAGGNCVLPRGRNLSAHDPKLPPPYRNRIRLPLEELATHVTGVERRLAREEFIQCRADGIDVVARRRLLTHRLLGAHIDQRAAVPLAHPRGRVPQATGHAEVRDLHDSSQRQHEIGRLKVPMHHACVLVGMIERRAELGQPRQEIRRLEEPVRLGQPQRGERRSLHQFHRDRRRLRIFDEIVDAHDVGMGQLPGPTCLGLEILECARIPSHHLGKKLQGDVVAQRRIPGLPDHPHAPRAQQFHQRIPAKHPLSGCRSALRRFEFGVTHRPTSCKSAARRSTTQPLPL